MKGAIIYSTRYGSTAQYAQWIAEKTGLPMFDLNDEGADPSNFDFIVYGAPIIYHKVYKHRWVKNHLDELLSKPIIFFTVSGARPGKKLDGWIQKCLPASFISHAKHVALLGRQNPKELRFYDRLMLIIGGLKNPDRKAGKEELHGFDFMDSSSIDPIVKLVEQYQAQPVLQ